MSHLDILLPFGLPPAEMAPDLLRELKTPALATLIARAKSRRDQTFDGFSRALPHEIWLARQFGLDRRLPIGGSPPIATAAMQAAGLTPDPGVWFMLHPAHLHVARDHLVLTDLRQLALSEHESHALFDAAKPLFEEFDRPLLYGDARTWFIRADAWDALRTSTPDAACGHNIDIWMPQGDGERDWRRLQNEVQMLWHSHAVNAEREARGLQTVNSVWLWGGTPTTMDSAPPRYREVFNLPGWAGAPRQPAILQKHAATASDAIATSPEHGLAVVDTLIEPALAGDWSVWLDRFHTLESDWFSPALEALKAGKIDAVSLIFSHGTHLSESSSGKQSVRKFWIKPSLSKFIR
ncbi:MAG: hypothetical protein JWQ21_2916 [Herminiimonas sp.]|nr:hypothetical protein [Herminiimonas sp.]